MANWFALFGKKLLSLSMIFSSLLSIVFAVGLLAGYYEYGWKLYEPYLIDGALFWMLILASIVNIFPSATVGHVITGRLWFHHYVYGFLVLVLAVVFLIVLAPISIFSLFTVYTTNVTVNVGRFFVLGGLTLILDDLPDVSDMLRRGLCFLKLKAFQARRIMHILQYILSFISLYLFVAIVLSIMTFPQEATFANVIFSATLLATCLISFGIAKQNMWLRITIP